MVTKNKHRKAVERILEDALLRLLCIRHNFRERAISAGEALNDVRVLCRCEQLVAEEEGAS